MARHCRGGLLLNAFTGSCSFACSQGPQGRQKGRYGKRENQLFHACSLLKVPPDQGLGSGLLGPFCRAASGYKREFNQDPFNSTAKLILSYSLPLRPALWHSLSEGYLDLTSSRNICTYTQTKVFRLEEDKNVRQDFKSLIHMSPGTWDLGTR